MIKRFISILTMLCLIQTFGVAQNTNEKSRLDYYLSITGVNTKNDVKAFESLIRSHKEITYFLGDRFPVRFFLLRSSTIITKDVINSWLLNTPYHLIYIGTGFPGKEGAIMAGKRNKIK